ncbi:MAG: hypothetical protein GY830_10910 [Bacteroidetes bacterium]|nr:hypothetical protein [Bacteroidota bacterium]
MNTFKFIYKLLLIQIVILGCSLNNKKNLNIIEASIETVDDYSNKVKYIYNFKNEDIVLKDECYFNQNNDLFINIEEINFINNSTSNILDSNIFEYNFLYSDNIFKKDLQDLNQIISKRDFFSLNLNYKDFDLNNIKDFYVLDNDYIDNEFENNYLSELDEDNILNQSENSDLFEWDDDSLSNQSEDSDLFEWNDDNLDQSESDYSNTENIWNFNNYIWDLDFILNDYLSPNDIYSAPHDNRINLHQNKKPNNINDLFFKAKKDYKKPCPICLQEGGLKKGEDIAICKGGEEESKWHIFHKDCINSWFNQNKGTCPICRSKDKWVYKKDYK